MNIERHSYFGYPCNIWSANECWHFIIKIIHNQDQVIFRLRIKQKKVLKNASPPVFQSCVRN